jgi:putative membrane protein
VVTVASDGLDTRTVVVLLVAALILLPLLTVGLGGGTMGGGMMGGGMWGGHNDGGVSGWWVLVGLVGRVLTLLVVVGVGYLLYRALTESGDGADEAMDELRLAYARGDLSDEEYERRRETLERDGG